MKRKRTEKSIDDLAVLSWKNIHLSYEKAPISIFIEIGAFQFKVVICFAIVSIDMEESRLYSPICTFPDKSCSVK